MRISFDIAPAVSIPKHLRGAYGALRILLWAAFAALLAYGAVKILFPNEYGYFDFTQYYGPDNTLILPRLSDGEITRGPVPEVESMIFNAIARGEFEELSFAIRAEEGDPAGTLEMVRTYRAMLFPEGDPAVLPDGTLAANDGEFYFVSDEALREIPEPLLDTFGFSRGKFLEISDRETALHGRGEPIGVDEYWTGGALFTDGEEFFQIREGRLDPFVSERAYLSRHRRQDARILDPRRDVPVADILKPIGFLDGTLLSYGGGVYAVEGEFVRPIDSPESFLAKGYAWEDVVEATEEEFSAYERGDIYGIERSHSSGTVFVDEDSNRHFLIDNGVRREIFGEHILDAYESIPAIPASADPERLECDIAPGRWGWYGCKRDIAGFGSGAEYQFFFTPKEDTELKEMKTVLVRGASWESFRTFLSDAKNRLLRK